MKRFLVINPFGIGDAIFSMTLVEALRRSHADAFIGFVCNERTVDLVRLNTSIDQTFVFNRDLFRRLWKKSPFLFYKKLRAFLKMLRENHFDTVYDLSLGREYSFFCWWIGIKKRIGLDYKNRGLFLTDKIKIDGYSGRQVAEIQLDLLNISNIFYKNKNPILPISVSAVAKSDVRDFLKKNGVPDQDKLITVAPGGGKSWGANAIYKQWDAERFAKTAQVFSEEQHSKVLLLGDRSERQLLEKTASFLRERCVIASGEEMEKVCALLLRSSLLCCNDGGLLHLANALGVKTVSIFGPVDEKVYGPYGNSIPHVAVTQEVPCRPCYQKFHFPPCPNERRCLAELPVEKVVAAMKKIA